MNAIIKHIINMFPFMIISLPILLIIRFLILKSNKKIKTNNYHEILLFIFIIFCVGLASQTLINEFEDISNLNNILNRINLTPFLVFKQTHYEVFKNGNLNYFTINFLGNIFMFVPFGLFLPMLYNKISFLKIALISFSISLFIETVQIFQVRGTDVDDLWLNTLGGLLGYLIYIVMGRLFKKFPNKFKVEKIK